MYRNLWDHSEESKIGISWSTSFSSLHATLPLLENLASSSRWCCETTGKVDLVTNLPRSPHEPRNKLSGSCTDHLDNDEAEQCKLDPSATYYDNHEFDDHDSTNARGMTAITFNAALHIYGPRKCRQIFPPPTLSGGKGHQ